MKKLFAILCAVMLIGAFTVPSAMSYDDCNQATHDIKAQATSSDASYSVSNWGYGNDYAYSNGGSYGEAIDKGIAKGTGVNISIGKASANSVTGACTTALDFGKTSVTAAGAKTTSHGDAAGYSKNLGGGWFDDKAANKSGAYIDGSVYQNQSANEVGYGSGTFAQGGNDSYAGYTAGAKDGESHTIGNIYGTVKADSHVNLTGAAGTAGLTKVTVDPYGRHQSADAFTGNVAVTGVKGADWSNTVVEGHGGVAVGANAIGNEAGSSAGGQAGFCYTGDNVGAGAAYLNADAVRNNHSASSTVSGGAISGAK